MDARVSGELQKLWSGFTDDLNGSSQEYFYSIYKPYHQPRLQ